MKRNIKITNKTTESKNRLQKVNLYPETTPAFDGYLSSYAENVFVSGRMALTEGKFHDMFMAGDGHELEDYTDKNGVFHVAHARSIFSSSMLAYNFFHWICPEHPLTLNGITYDKVYFEVKFPVMAKTSKGRPINRPSNMDVVLVSEDCTAMLCIESKYTEHTHHQEAIFSDAYFKPSCYYKGNPYRTSFIQMALRYNEKGNGYYAGIKQNVSHLIGITNIMHDADALAWFKANNPFIEPEVMEEIGAHTEFIFTNLLYCRPEMADEIFGDIQAEEKTYPYLLGELLYDHLQKALDEPLLLSRFIITYPELFAEIQSQMPEHLANYLDNRYEFTMQPHFPLPDGYDIADHYLIDVVMDGAKERYQDNFSDAVTARIQRELKAIRVHQWADRLLIAWDLIHSVLQQGFCKSPGANNIPGSVVAYCLGITDIEPLSSHLCEKDMMYRPTFPKLYIEFSSAGKHFAQHYLADKYGELASQIRYNDSFMMDIVEYTITASGQDIDFRTLPYHTPEQLQFFMSDSNWRQYSYFGEEDMKKLHAIKHPTFEDMVRIFSIRTFPDGTTNIFPWEHCYGRCVLALRAAWLKMHYPMQFKAAVIIRSSKNKTEALSRLQRELEIGYLKAQNILNCYSSYEQ